MKLKDRIIEYTDCPGCGHELTDHNDIVGCLDFAGNEESCLCILNADDIEHLREWWEENPRMIND